MEYVHRALMPIVPVSVLPGLRDWAAWLEVLHFSGSHELRYRLDRSRKHCASTCIRPLHCMSANAIVLCLTGTAWTNTGMFDCQEK
ncbi:hypothetical protein BKA82DRAFT_869168 [Pisolithus tinctorius]|uniref:Uncharacterized protein n=1 Tax=Pisolithus tinctorius Marx 270 TaxID=870435 RepID=A0A0C3PQ45_PISTI|nr:hypothetical protein BKA82DRAFT_869168 [Pisolithus tinctorius]KIO10629.1 hypothetical protein M404DRAFT_869168 [Pisolithus tinctorius Marx 270]